MKLASVAALVGLLGSSALAAKAERTFAIAHFAGKEIMIGSVDPIVDPGVKSKHVHSVMGASNFGLTVDASTLKDSKCTNVRVGGDYSIYWTPKLYFHDKDKNTFEPVAMYYMNVYYFFEATNDDIKPFPLGLHIFAGDSARTTPPNNGTYNLDPSKGEVTPATFTCPRSGAPPHNPPSWPADSDGSSAGIAISDGEGLGFPLQNCDGQYSPLRADIHMPSCYNPKAGLENYKENMAYPINGDCPENYIHLPHLFFETYWDTQPFKDRWTPDGKTQPFVLSNGDVTGYSLHADFIAGWDEPTLQTIIDTCNAGTAGLETCPNLLSGLNPNPEGCTIENPIDEVVGGVLDALPGTCPLRGYQYGEAAAAPSATIPDSKPADAPASSSSSSSSSSPSSTPAKTAAPVSTPAQGSSNDDHEAAGEGKAEDVTSTATACTTTVHTVWETVTVTGSPTPVAGATDDSPARANSTLVAGNYKYAGCFKDSNSRALSGEKLPDLGAMTNDKCASHCESKGFTLAGTEYGGQCYCGNELAGSSQLDDSKCAAKCSGDDSTICGGDWALSVYSVDGEAELTSTIKLKRASHGHVARHRSVRM